MPLIRMTRTAKLQTRNSVLYSPMLPLSAPSPLPSPLATGRRCPAIAQFALPNLNPTPKTSSGVRLLAATTFTEGASSNGRRVRKGNKCAVSIGQFQSHIGR